MAQATAIEWTDLSWNPVHGCSKVSPGCAQELWREIPSHPNYEASSEGRIRRAKPGKGTRVGRVLRTPIDSQGYPAVNIDGRPRRVHVLVAEAFHGPIPPGGQVHHQNEDKTDARARNLLITASPLAHGEQHRRSVSRRRRHGEANPPVACACGCGERFPKFDAGGRPRRYVTGHNYDTDHAGRYAPRRQGGEAQHG